MRVKVTVDRPIGFLHHGCCYEVNYGYIYGGLGGDGSQQDAYILDRHIDYPVDEYCGNVIAVAVRSDDVETKWIVSNEKWLTSEIYDRIKFIEQYFVTKIYLIENFPAHRL